jgi:TonB family protein
MMRLWWSSYAKPAPAASGAAGSVVVHALLISAWVVATLPGAGVANDSLANHQYPQYVPPPDRVISVPGSHESLHFVTLATVAGIGTGDGPRTIGNLRPVSPDETASTAPVDSAPAAPAPALPQTKDSVFTVLDVDSAVARSENSAAPAYPLKLLSEHITGSVLARYVVDTTGFADSASFRVMKSTNAAFENAVREALPYMRFRPAKIGTAKVRQLVEQTFSFRIAESLDSASAKPPAAPAKKSAPGHRPAR